MAVFKSTVFKSTVFNTDAGGGFSWWWAANVNSIIGGNMKKNVAGQSIGAQLIDATTGGAFSGTVTIYITGDNGTQTIGSVGSGICTAEGNGYYSYAPAQAETNFDHISFTFVGTGAIPATAQLFTDFPQTGDAFGLVGTAGAGLTAIGDTRIANLDATISSRLAAASYTAPDNAGIGTIITAVGNVPTANENADALLDRADAIESGLTLRGATRLNTSVLAGKVSGGGTGTETFRNVGDTKDRVISTVDVDGNRTAVTTDAT
jgi:hypothetical protein